MTPAERIAAALAVWDPQDFMDWNWVIDKAIDALCPKGESIRLDRTGDTDRLVRQHPAVNVWLTNRRQLGLPPLWVDVEDGPDE